MTEPDVAALDEDHQLLAAHLDGDRDAFNELVRRHRQRMWAVAVRTLGDPEEAADAVQDACISALRAAVSFRGDSKVSTWLHRIVVNACLDRARRQAVRHTVPLPTEPIADQRDPLGERETALEVQQALAALPTDQRIAIVLVDLEGLSIDEASELLGVPGGTIKSRCFRGRARLAVSLGHLRNPVPDGAVPPRGAPQPDNHHHEAAEGGRG